MMSDLEEMCLAFIDMAAGRRQQLLAYTQMRNRQIRKRKMLLEAWRRFVVVRA